MTSAEECREGVSPFLRTSRGGFQSSALLLWYSPLRLVYALRWSYSRDRQHMAEKIHPDTHTHEMSYMRCFKDIATPGTGLVDAEAVQPENHAFLAQQEFIRAKSGFDLDSVLANVC